MKTSAKLLLIVLTMLVVFWTSMFTPTMAQDTQGVKLAIKHKPGEVRTVKISKIITRNVLQDDEKAKDKNKLTAYEMNFTETCIQADDSGKVDRLFLKVLKSRKKADDKSEIVTNYEEGKTSVLTGDELAKYQKMQPDFGLILPAKTVTVNEIWKPNAEQMKQLFGDKVQDDNPIAYKLTKLARNQNNLLVATIERELELKFIVPAENEEVESNGIEKSRTTYMIDVENQRILNISEAQILIMNVKDKEDQQIAMQVATETTYEYSAVQMYKTQIKPESMVEQTEQTFVNFDLKMLIATKEDNSQLATTKNSESDKIYKRKPTKIVDGEVAEYALKCEYDKTIETETSIKGKKSINLVTSKLDGQSYVIRRNADGTKKVLNENSEDVTTETQLPENSLTGIKMNLPAYPIPVGYTIDVSNNETLSILSGMFKQIEINSMNALMTFNRVFKQDNRSIAEFKLEIALTGKTQEFGRLIFAITIFNYLDLDKNRIVRTFTNPLKKDDPVLRLLYENAKLKIDGIGTMQIDSKFMYSDEKKTNEVLGSWVLLDSESGAQKKAYKLTFDASGLLTYTHPHLNGKDTLHDNGVWRVQNDILTVKFGFKKDIFQFKIEENELILTKLAESTNATSIFPFRVGENDKYQKSAD